MIPKENHGRVHCSNIHCDFYLCKWGKSLEGGNNERVGYTALPSELHELNFVLQCTESNCVSDELTSARVVCL